MSVTAPRRSARFGLAALLAAALAPAAPAQSQPQPRVYIAFGDSITFGFGDTKDEGYPGRLATLLDARGVPATVVNAGLPGESTSGALSRINGVLNGGGDAILIMEGTNDVNAHVSVETITFNLDQLAQRAEARGIKAIHVTVIPRMPTANTDGDNAVTGGLAESLRELAWENDRDLVDPFEVFFYDTPDVFSEDYLGGTDRLHPNDKGYDILAGIFADALTGVDKVAPVNGRITPADGARGVSPTALVGVDLYDFGKGIDLANTHLLLDDQPVDTTPTGDSRKVELRYQPTVPLVGVVTIGIRSQDLATPPNMVERNLGQFVIAGTTFLAGDINRDGRVDGADLVALGLHFGERRGDPRFLPGADLNGDGIIDGLDLAILASNFGNSSF